MQVLLSFFQQQGFTTNDAEAIAKKFSLKALHKGEFFVEEGKTSKHLGFIEKGYLHYFSVLDGLEKTTYAVGEGNFVASLLSFLKQVPAPESIRAITDTDIWIIHREDVKRLQNEIPAFQHFYTGILEWQICCIDESRLDAIVLSPQERYQKMMHKEPGLIQNLPLQYLASILGITPRHLSRIRNNIM